MAINEHPAKGTILRCDFNQGFCEPEMTKRRPVIVLSPKITNRYRLCTVVALSTTPPDLVMPYHGQIDIRPCLPPPLTSDGIWVKGDMIYTVGFHRLDFYRFNKVGGKRNYYYSALTEEQMKQIQTLVLRGMGLGNLTKHL